MYKRLHDNSSTSVTITFDGKPIAAIMGESIAAALLVAGVVDWRKSIKSNQARAPYCMMGMCYECLVEIDGQVVQACSVAAEEGLVVKRIDNTIPRHAQN